MKVCGFVFLHSLTNFMPNMKLITPAAALSHNSSLFQIKP